MTKLEEKNQIMTLALSDGENKKELSIGLSEILGEAIGDKVVTLD